METGRIGSFFLRASGRRGHRLQEMPREKGRRLKVPEKGHVKLDLQFMLSIFC